MGRWVLGVVPTALDGSVYFCPWHLSFLGKAMGSNNDVAPVKEVQNPVMNVSRPGAKFPNAPFKQIAMGTPEIVPRFREHLDPDQTFVARLG